jgi:hypothetical protein
MDSLLFNLFDHLLLVMSMAGQIVTVMGLLERSSPKIVVHSS